MCDAIGTCKAKRLKEYTSCHEIKRSVCSKALSSLMEKNKKCWQQPQKHQDLIFAPPQKS